MSAGSAEAAARYSVRPLLPGPADALRDAVLRLGHPPERLTVLAERGAVEALALRGLSSDQIRVIERLVTERRRGAREQRLRSERALVEHDAYGARLRDMIGIARKAV